MRFSSFMTMTVESSTAIHSSLSLSVTYDPKVCEHSVSAFDFFLAVADGDDLHLSNGVRGSFGVRCFFDLRHRGYDRLCLFVAWTATDFSTDPRDHSSCLLLPCGRIFLF